MLGHEQRADARMHLEPAQHLAVPPDAVLRASSPWSAVVARENRHWLWSNDTPRQPFARATTSRAARQCTAWLSPTSAKLTCARVAGSPNAHAAGPVREAIGAHGALGVIAASIGDGVTEKRSRGLRHRCSGSRAAAPKHRCRADARAGGGRRPLAGAAPSVASDHVEDEREPGQVFCW